MRKAGNDYLDSILLIKSDILKELNKELEKATTDVSQAYFGTHSQVPTAYKNMVGEGAFWRHYNERYQIKKIQFDQMDKEFHQLDEHIRMLQTSLNHLTVDTEKNILNAIVGVQEVQLQFNKIATRSGHTVPQAPVLMTYDQFSQDVTPSFAMWTDFSLFAFACAAMVDFFTFLLSYRLETTAPGPLSEHEQELVFECLRQFSEFRINENDELEMVIEKSDLERARRYSDWSRMFAVGFLLSRGFLRKIDERSVEFAPNLYPLIAERMGAKLRQIKAESLAASKADNNQVSDE
jgi:hypothetical protein